MTTIIKILLILALCQYIYKGSLDFRASLKNWLYRLTHPTRHTKADSELTSYSELASVYVEPTLGSGKELEPFKDFDKYRDELFEEGNYNPPTGIYVHESEVEDEQIAVDLYEKEIAI